MNRQAKESSRSRFKKTKDQYSYQAWLTIALLRDLHQNSVGDMPCRPKVIRIIRRLSVTLDVVLSGFNGRTWEDGGNGAVRRTN